MTQRNIQEGDEVEVGRSDERIVSGVVQEITPEGIAIIDTGQGTFEAHIEDCRLFCQDSEEEEDD